MTGRKPPGISWRAWIDLQIEQGLAQGDFDGLPGHGKPLVGIDEPLDELWWVRDKLRREGVEYLPPSLAIRKKAAAARQRAESAQSERDARRILQEINDEILYLNRTCVEGPPTTLMPFDIEEALESRRKHLLAGVEQVPATRVVRAASAPCQGSARHGLLARLQAWLH